VPRVAFASLAEATSAPFPAQTGVTAFGTLACRALISAVDRPISLWVHEVAAGAGIRFSGPTKGHALYLLSGSVDAGGRIAEEGGAVIVEHGATATLTALGGGATLVHFHRPEAHPEAPRKAGGCVHVVGEHGIFQTESPNTGGNQTLYADAECPTCDLWLHKTHIPANFKVIPHFHTEDETQFSLEGGIYLGNRLLGKHSALAVDANTVYTFTVAEQGITYLNFRPTEPFDIHLDAEGKEHTRRSARTYIKEILPGLVKARAAERA
jgi:hypothetical protein